MLLMGPVLVLLPVLLLVHVVFLLGAHGPLGWAAAAGFVVACAHGTRLAVQCGLRWWRSTKAPERPASAGVPRSW